MYTNLGLLIFLKYLNHNETTKNRLPLLWDGWMEYSLRPPIIVDFGYGTGFKKCKENQVKKNSGIWVLLLFISIIIKCKLNKLVECETYLSFKKCELYATYQLVEYNKSESEQLIRDEQK